MEIINYFSDEFNESLLKEAPKGKWLSFNASIFVEEKEETIFVDAVSLLERVQSVKSDGKT